MSDFLYSPESQSIKSFNQQFDKQQFEKSVDKLIDFLADNREVAKHLVRYALNVYLTNKNGDL